jgi:hypothetical protein
VSTLSVIRPTVVMIVSRRSSTTALTASILANLAVPVTCKSRILARPESSLTGFEPVSVRHTPPTDNDTASTRSASTDFVDRFPVRCSV